MHISYLASPYSHTDPKVSQRRLHIVNQVVLELRDKGQYVYSPLTHNIPSAPSKTKGDWSFWKEFDQAMLLRCDSLLVLKLAGWEESTGVQAEIAYAQEKGIPIEWMEYDEASFNASQDVAPISQLLNTMLNFYKERDWDQFHSPKNLAMSLSIEAAELMEHFRWLKEEDSFIQDVETLSQVREEIGDVFQGIIYLAHKLGIDPIEAAQDKLMKTGAKYPVEESKGKCLKYTHYKTLPIET